MAWIIGSALAIIGVAILFVAAVAIVVAVIELLVRVTLATGLAVLCGCVAGIAADHLGADGMVAGVIVSLLAFVPALLSVWKWRNYRANVSDGPGAGTQRVIEVAPEIQIERKLGLTDAARLSAAWDKASQLALQSDLSRPRLHCARFLAAFEAEVDCDPANVELAMFIRRHVPGLVDETQAVLHDAVPEEREALLAALVADLKQLGEEACDASERRSGMASERLRIRRSHFARRREGSGGLA